MASIEEMLIGDVQEETEEKIDIEHGFPHLTALSSSDEQHAKVSCFYSYHYILCIYLSINNHCLENATNDPLHRHCSSEKSITY